MAKRTGYLAASMAALLVFCGSPRSEAGTVTIFQRESFGRLNLFAGSGGAVDQSDVSDSLGALTGGFSFSDSNAVAVDESNPFSNGSASAEGAISVTDNVVQSSPGSFSLTATRTASGTAIYGSGTGNGQVGLRQTFRVRFEIHDDPATYTLTGNFDPGVLGTRLGTAHRVKLHRPLTSNVLVNPAAATTLNETGTLNAGNVYELDIRMNDILAASAGNPFDSDVSSLNIEFNVTSVPEPSSASLVAVAWVLLAARRRRPR